jgi:hypothetical protein
MEKVGLVFRARSRGVLPVSDGIPFMIFYFYTRPHKRRYGHPVPTVPRGVPVTEAGKAVSVRGSEGTERRIGNSKGLEI